MRMAAAGILSTAVLLSSACDRPEPSNGKPDPVRNAAYKSQWARHNLLRHCAMGATARVQDQRLDQLRQFATQKQLGDSIWLGENDFRAHARYAADGRSGPCCATLLDERPTLGAGDVPIILWHGLQWGRRG